MTNLLEYMMLNMASKNEQDEITKNVGIFINDVFSHSYANELTEIYKKVKITERTRKGDIIAMSFGSRKIEINPHEFYALSKTEQSAYIAHELLHISNSKGNFKIKTLNKKLWKIYSSNLKQGADISLVMVGKAKVSSRWINKDETTPYLMTQPIRWEYLISGTKDKVKQAISESGLFNMNSTFLTKVLS